MEATRDGHRQSLALPNTLKSMIDKLLRCRVLQQEVLDTIELPIPFPYFHLLNVMIAVNLLIWAYGMGITKSVFAPIVYLFSALIFMGMIELAAQLADPFGDDVVDFPVHVWVSELVEDLVMLVQYGYEEAAQCWRPILDLNRPL